MYTYQLIQNAKLSKKRNHQNAKLLKNAVVNEK